MIKNVDFLLSVIAYLINLFSLLSIAPLISQVLSLLITAHFYFFTESYCLYPDDYQVYIPKPQTFLFNLILYINYIHDIFA